MRNSLLSLSLLAALAMPAAAEVSVDSDILKLGIDTRVDYQYNAQDGHTDKSTSGFMGKYLMLRADGQIVPGLTYSWRQRFNKEAFDSNFFNATDWIYLNYAIKGWNFQVGKEVVNIGSWEYDRNPIDIFDFSVFTGSIPCYQLGVSVGYDITPSDRLTLQATQSPFFTKENRDMYGFNLSWSGRHGFFEPLYSVNMEEYADGRWINYIALGNRFSFDKFRLELDFMNRAASGQTFFFKDCSVVADLSYRPTDRWNVFAKYSYDVNKTDKFADFCVLPGTELNMIGAGAEFFPLITKKHSLRVHAALFYSWGQNGNPNDLMQQKSLLVSAGVTWHFDVLNIHRK